MKGYVIAGVVVFYVVIAYFPARWLSSKVDGIAAGLVFKLSFFLIWCAFFFPTMAVIIALFPELGIKP